MKAARGVDFESLACTWALQSSLRRSATVCRNNIGTQPGLPQTGRSPHRAAVAATEQTKSVKPGKVYLMRRKNVLSRFATLALATLACLLLAVLAPMISIQRASDEPFSGYAVMASPRDMHVITTPIRLSDAPDLTLNRGTLYADGNAALGTPISRFVLDGPVFYLNASGLRTAASSFEAAFAGVGGSGARDHCAAAGRSADRHGVRCADDTPRHALRDRGGRQLGDDRRHPGRADGTAQGPGLGSRQLHDPRPAARLRRHARSRRPRSAIRRAGP